jgi:hypothetical protein
MQHLTLPSGATADLRDVADVTERMRRPVKRLQAKLTAIPEFAVAVRDAQAAEKSADGELTPDQQIEIAAGLGAAFDVLEDLNDALCAALVAGWSLGFAVSADAMQDLPGRDLDALRKACGPFLAELNPDFEPSPAADSPTAPSIA